MSIDPDVWTLARAKYPGLLSGMVEDYLRSVLGADVHVSEDSSLDEIEGELGKAAQEMKLAQIKVKTLQAERKLKQEQEQKMADADLQERLASTRALKKTRPFA